MRQILVDKFLKKNVFLDGGRLREDSLNCYNKRIQNLVTNSMVRMVG